ncbi:unnamed protein product, partial [Urochloa humidicola]
HSVACETLAPTLRRTPQSRSPSSPAPTPPNPSPPPPPPPPCRGGEDGKQRHAEPEPEPEPERPPLSVLLLLTARISRRRRRRLLIAFAATASSSPLALNRRQRTWGCGLQRRSGGVSLVGLGFGRSGAGFGRQVQGRAFRRRAGIFWPTPVRIQALPGVQRSPALLLATPPADTPQIGPILEVADVGVRVRFPDLKPRLHPRRRIIGFDRDYRYVFYLDQREEEVTGGMNRIGSTTEVEMKAGARPRPQLQGPS